MTTPKIHALIIDPQYDFCDLPSTEQATASVAGAPTGRIAPALPVPGAHADMLRLAAFIERAGARLAHIHVTLDSHNPVDIAHPHWWIDPDGEPPAPFTAIRLDDVGAGRWRARRPELQARSLAYVEALEADAHYALTIWPEHCLIGHVGHTVHPAVATALADWSRSQLRIVDFVTKGSNPFTEHYSALRAEVVDPTDPGTQLNTRLIESLADADQVFVAGEALSHCVANTVRDLAAAIGDDRVRRLILLEDCTSPVAGFEELGRAFVAEMVGRGMKVATGTDAPCQFCQHSNNH